MFLSEYLSAPNVLQQINYPVSFKFKNLRDDTDMTSMKLVQFLRPPTPLVHLSPKFFHHFDLGRPTSNEPPPVSK